MGLFNVTVEKQTQKFLESLTGRLCFSIDGLKDAGLKVVDTFSAGEIRLTWTTKGGNKSQGERA